MRHFLFINALNETLFRIEYLVPWPGWDPSSTEKRD
jgi:hypothetical protein